MLSLAHNFVERVYGKGFAMTQRVTAALLALSMSLVLFIHRADAQITIYYQPTPYPSTIHGGIHILDGWLPSVYYGRTFQMDDGRLQIGGWGDNYRTYIQFDLTGLPASVSSAELQLYAYPRGDNSTLVNFDAWSPNSTWANDDQTTSIYDLKTSMDWDSQPSGFSLVGSYATSPTNSFWPIRITSLYNNWMRNPTSNRGIVLMPWTQNNNFDVWRSSRWTDATQRPRLRLTFTPPAGMPNFKIPLLGGARWLLTNEIGGYECMAESPTPDTSHQGNNYYALDFSATNIKDGGGSYSGPIPILAAAGGTVHSTGYHSETGYYIILNHGNGYLTRYIHFDTPAARKNGTLLVAGNSVNQGDQIGLMGSLGIGSGKHLHINFWHNGTFNGAHTVTNLSYVVMDGLLLKSYQTECSANSSGVPIERIRYYHSSNTATGN